LRADLDTRFAAFHELLKSEVRRLDERLARLEHSMVEGRR
jgi:hypothetical protein